MSETHDRAAGATLLEDLPDEKDGSRQYRELISDTLQRCYDYAGTMTPEGRARLHIETADGERIEAAEIAAHFGDEAVEAAELGPAGLA